MSTPAPTFGPVVPDMGPIDRLSAYLQAFAERWGTYPESLAEYSTEERQR